MSDWASSTTTGMGRGTNYYDGSNKLIAVDPRPSLSLLAEERFRTTYGIFTPQNTSTLYPITNGSHHTWDKSAVSLTSEGLRIEASKIGTGAPDTATWKSGYLDTSYGFSAAGPLRGIMRFKSTNANSMWPSGWALPKRLAGQRNSKYGAWPRGGEWDWWEGKHTRSIFTVHMDDPLGSGTHVARPNYEATPPQRNYIDPVDFTSDFVEVWADWWPGIGWDWWWNGTLVQTVREYPHPPHPWAGDDPFEFIIQLAVGSDNGFIEYPDVTTPTSGNVFLIDRWALFRMRQPSITVNSVSIPCVKPSARGGTVTKLIKDDGNELFPSSVGGGGGGSGGGGGGGGTGLQPAGPHALWNPTTSPNRVPIDWTAANIDNTHLITSSLMGTTGAPYVALADSGCALYWTTTATVGRLTINIGSGGWNPGSYTVYCPPGAQPSRSGSDGPIQIIQPDGSFVTVYAVAGSAITWNGNTASCSASGYIRLANYKTDTAWPNGTIVGYPNNSYNKHGFAAAGCDVMAGAITPEDKQLGYIAHAIQFIFANNGLANGPRLPAMRTDSPQGSAYPSGNTVFHPGTLIAIPPPSRGGATQPSGWTAWQRAIPDALTNYGAYVTDRSEGFVVRACTRAEPGVTATLTSLDFSSFMSLAAGSVGRFVLDNARIITGGKPVLGSAHA